jgi:hypothetical protein
MSMEVEVAFAVPVAHCVLDVVIEEQKVPAAFVRHYYLHSGSKRHGDVAVEALALRASKQGRLKYRHMPERHPEEIAKWHAHGRLA